MGWLLSLRWEKAVRVNYKLQSSFQWYLKTWDTRGDGSWKPVSFILEGIGVGVEISVSAYCYSDVHLKFARFEDGKRHTGSALVYKPQNPKEIRWFI